jgi:hypothetical protein
MATETSTQREKQEQSIKARKKELFVDEQVDSGPRKTFREYLRETPATPLSKNVKLMLWGSAAPVLLLFLGALWTGTGSTAKPPENTVLPPSPPKPLAAKTDEQPPKQAVAPKEEKPKDEAQSKENSPTEDKPKPKNPKDDAAQSGEKDTKPGKGEGDAKRDNPEKMPNNVTSSQEDKEKAKAKGKSEPNPKDADTSLSPTPDKHRRAPLFKKKKDPVFTYPKREGKKKDEKADPEKTKSSF